MKQSCRSSRLRTRPGVATLPEEELTQLLERVRHFDEFTADNDPHGEHDLGNVELAASEIRH
jgi:hypothetical protein